MIIDTSTLIVVITSVSGLGATIVMIIKAFSDRGVPRADIAEKVTQAWDPLVARLDDDIERLNTKSDKCEARLAVTERELGTTKDRLHRFEFTLKALVQAIKSRDQALEDIALAGAEDLING